jgi:phosphatidylserine/phosphatidylglycerophosphate/cardiolipin synthase-like enzyme
MNHAFITLLILLSFNNYAKVSALFHPYQDTFSAITERFAQADSQIDMALYNIDASANNPIIAFFATDSVQARIKSGDLKVRLVFEGYEKKDKNFIKMEKLESLGIDVKYLGSSKKMHHKFAIVDGYKGNNDAFLITGSANWSMSSLRNYNENILFFDHEQKIASSYQKQFDLLWELSKEIGIKRTYEKSVSFRSLTSEVSIAHFNTENFEVRNNRLYKSRKEQGFVLTKKIAAAIDKAESHIKIATTRFKLRPIYDAIKRAAKRGVKVDIVVTMGEYEYKYMRKKMKEQKCADIFNKKCSTSKNFSILLSREDFIGSELVDVRIKFFNVSLAAYLSKQMHSKYMIVDDKKVLTGSFNWSYSAEFNHIENLIVLEGSDYRSAHESFLADFTYLWNMGRSHYSGFVKKVAKAAKAKKKINCAFKPMVLTFGEIDKMLSVAKKNKSSLKKVCL